MTVAITTTYDTTPGPAVRITITGITGTDYVYIWRGDGTTETRVPGDDQQVPSGAVYLTDYRPAPGRTVTYRAVLYTSAGVVVATVTSTPLAVPAIDPSMAWVMDPEDPTNAMLLPLMLGTDATVDHSSAGVSVPVLSGKPLWLGGPMAKSRPFVLKTSTVAEADQFDQMVDVGNVLLIRPGAAMRHDTGLVYIGTSSISEAPRHPYEGPARWSFDGPEVADDDWPTVVAEWTWQDIKDNYATWADVKAAYATWLAVKAG